MDAVSTFPSAAEVAALSGADLDHALVAVERARRELEAAYVAVLDRADDTKRFNADGHAGIRGWASALADTGPVELHRRLQTMRALRDLPAVASALAQGEVGVDQVREIARLHANPRTRELTVEGQSKLIRHGRTKAFVEFAEVVGRWDAFGDPHRSERRHRDAHERRDAMIFEKDGAVHLRAKGGTLQGAALIEIFQRQCDAEFLDDWEHAKTIAGDGDVMAALARTDAQRRFDAIHSLFLGAVSAPPGSVAPEPVVHLFMNIDEYEARLDDLATGRRPAQATVDNVDTKRCETDTGIPIDPYDAVMASLTGWFRRVIVDSAGVVIDLGRKRRYTGSARVAVTLSRRRCLWPGCGRASTRNQIDHTHEHSRGGLRPHPATAARRADATTEPRTGATPCTATPMATGTSTARRHRTHRTLRRLIVLPLTPGCASQAVRRAGRIGWVRFGVTGSSQQPCCRYSRAWRSVLD